MEDPLPTDVQRVFQAVVGFLGEAFSIEQLLRTLPSVRERPLKTEARPFPVETVGCVIALKDMDLLCLGRDLDSILERMTLLHEVAHLLLNHVAACPSSPTYIEFCRHPEQYLAAGLAVKKAFPTDYDDPREDAAETLATLLLICVSRYEAAMPQTAMSMYGYGRTA